VSTTLFFSLRENEAEFFESIVVKTHHSLFYSIYSNLFLIFLKEKEDYLLFFRPLKLNHFSTNRTTLGHLLPFDSNVAPSIFSRLPTLTTYPPSPLKILDNIRAASSPPIQIKTGGRGCPWQQTLPSPGSGPTAISSPLTLNPYHISIRNNFKTP
jgi:hypothetical protein